MNLKQGIFSLVLVTGLAGLTGCGSETGPSASAPEEPSSAAATMSQSPAVGDESPTAEPTGESGMSEEVMITISEFEYEVPESVAPGATVTVVNQDAAPHTVTAQDEGGFDVETPAGETVTFTAPEEPGEYPIICNYHPQMSGTLVVQ